MNQCQSNAKIAFVYAGGTLGMNRKQGSDVLAPPKNGNDFQKVAGPILRDFQSRFGAKVSFHLFDTMDSTDRAPDSIGRLFKFIKKLQSEVDAIVVGHGTDLLTCVATASALGMANPHFPGTSSQICPIVFTAAQKPLVFKEGDALANLFHALETAYILLLRSISRTVIAFQSKVLDATRAMKTHDDRFDAFDSPGVPSLGDISAHGVNIYPHVKSINFKRHNLKFDIGTGASSIIIGPSMKPGQLYRQALPDENDVSIITTLGAGNIPKRLLPDIEKLTSEGHACILATPFAGGKVSQVYESGSEAVKAGGISARDMLPRTAEIKALLLRGYGIKNRDEFVRLFQTPWLDEISGMNK